MDFSFLLKKLISSAIMPLSIGLIILFIGLIYLYKNQITKSKIFLTFGFIFIIAVSSNPLSTSLIKPLESKYKKLNTIPKDIKYIVILGGDISDRGWELLRVYNYIKDATIITSGYKGEYNITEATRTKNLLISIGINKDKIIAITKPKDTNQEAIYLKKVVGTKPFILVTSAYHMPRAMLLLKAKGLNPVAAPTDFKPKPNESFFSIPNGEKLRRTEYSWHEYIGILWSKIKGDI